MLTTRKEAVLRVQSTTVRSKSVITVETWQQCIQRVAPAENLAVEKAPQVLRSTRIVCHLAALPLAPPRTKISIMPMASVDYLSST